MRIMLPLSRRASLSLIAAGVTVAAVVVIAPGSASAAVSYVLLGRSNYTATQTNISNRSGTPLGLNAKSGYAPLAVNSAKQVNRLNADYVNGYHASSFAKVTGKTGIIVSTAIATCPKSTTLTGGGGFGNGSMDYSGPYPTFSSDGNSITGFVPNTWVAVSLTGGTVYSYAVCYSPTGAAIPGAGIVPAAAASTLKSSSLNSRSLKSLMPGGSVSPVLPPPAPAPAPSPTQSPLR